MKKQTEKTGLNISAKSFITAIVVIFILMTLAYSLTFIIPGGSLPAWKWLASPVLVLGTEGNVSLIAIIAFLLVIGGVFNCLDKCGLMKYMLDAITYRFGRDKYNLLAFVTLFFMAMGTFIGSFEEVVPLVPIVVALSIRLGWDALVGVGMSLLAIGCGFSAGICNPFTVGVAQELAGLPMFSGFGFRALIFVFVYALLVLFLIHYARRIEVSIDENRIDRSFVLNKKMSKGLLCFGVIMGVGIIIVLSSAFLTFLQDYTIIIVAVTFFISGLIATIVSGRGGNIGKTFVKGACNVFPAVLMILMANSIRYIMEEGNILDTILQGMVSTAQMLPRWSVILFIYAIVLIMNFFISSGSAKAFLLIPLIMPIAEVFDISLQLCILAFAFGDGFSNVFYPTNPVLLIGLGVADVDYGTWIKWSWKFQVINLFLTSCLLLLGLAIGY